MIYHFEKDDEERNLRKILADRIPVGQELSSAKRLDMKNKVLKRI